MSKDATCRADKLMTAPLLSWPNDACVAGLISSR